MQGPRVEIQKQPQVLAREAKVRQKLRGVNRLKLLDGLDLDDNEVLNRQTDQQKQDTENAGEKQRDRREIMPMG